MSKQTPKPEPSGEDTSIATVVEATVVEAPLTDAEQGALERAAAYALARKAGPATGELIAYLASEALETADLNEVITEQLSARLLDAQTPDEILTPFDPAKGIDFLMVPLNIHEVSFVESDYTEGCPYYAIIQGTNIATGKPFTATIGGERVVFQLAALHRGGFLPYACRIHKADKPTKAGFYPLDLIPAI